MEPIDEHLREQGIWAQWAGVHCLAGVLLDGLGYVYVEVETSCQQCRYDDDPPAGADRVVDGVPHARFLDVDIDARDVDRRESLRDSVCKIEDDLLPVGVVCAMSTQEE